MTGLRGGTLNPNDDDILRDDVTSLKIRTKRLAERIEKLEERRDDEISVLRYRIETLETIVKEHLLAHDEANKSLREAKSKLQLSWEESEKQYKDLMMKALKGNE